MSEAETKKAIECCKIEDCLNCPLKTKAYNNKCKDILFESVIDIINRKNAEIEQFADIGKLYSEIKAEARVEAIKEFAERVKLRFSGTMSCSGGLILREVDKIAKEMGVEL